MLLLLLLLLLTYIQHHTAAGPLQPSRTVCRFINWTFLSAWIWVQAVEHLESKVRVTCAVRAASEPHVPTSGTAKNLYAKTVLQNDTAASTAHIHHTITCRATTHYVAILSPVACPPVQYFSILSHKRYDFPKTLSNTKCVFCFTLQISFETFHILRMNKRDMIRNVEGSLWKVPLL